MLGHPNYVSLIIISTYLAYTYLIYDKKDYLQYVIGILLIVLLGFTTRSRTAMLIIGLIMAMLIISKIKIKKEFIAKAFKLISKYAFVFIAIFTFIFLCFGSKEYTVTDKKIDNIISGRIWYSEKGYRQNDLTLLGKGIPYDEQGLILDNLYAKSVVNYGIVYLFILSYLLVENI